MGWNERGSDGLGGNEEKNKSKMVGKKWDGEIRFDRIVVGKNAQYDEARRDRTGWWGRVG